MAEKKKDNRTRNWTFVLYPDSAPKNWRSIIDDLHVEWVESPLHDKDINADDTPKKAHWHIMICFEGNKSFEQVLEITEQLKGTIPKKVQSCKGLTRYLCHLDNPEKYQYDKSDIIGHGGFDVAEMLKPTSSAKYVLIKEMSQYIKENNITEYEDLYFYAMYNRFDDWFPLLCDSATYVLNALIKSRRNRMYRNVEEKKFNAETGEIL